MVTELDLITVQGWLQPELKLRIEELEPSVCSLMIAFDVIAQLVFEDVGFEKVNTVTSPVYVEIVADVLVASVIPKL